MTELLNVSKCQFVIGHWRIDTLSNEIIIDQRIADFLSLQNTIYSFDGWLSGVELAEPYYTVRSVLDNLKSSSSQELSFEFSLRGVAYHVDASVENFVGEQPVRCGYAHIRAASCAAGVTSESERTNEALLKEANQKLSELTEQRNIASRYLRSAIVYVDLDYNVKWSTISEGVNNYLRDYRAGTKCYKSVFNRDTPCDVCSLKAVKETLKSCSYQYEADGHVWEISAFPSLNAEGELKGVILRQEDITKRKTNERKLLELNHLMEAILNNIPLYLFVKNPNDDFRYLYWNKAFAEHSHIPSKVAVGSTDEEIFPNSADVMHFRKDDLRLLEGGETIEFEEEYITASGKKRAVQTIKMLIQTEQPLPWIMGLSWDITEVKRYQSELIKARKEAEESDKFKSQFVANMSHEIRTPLNAIVGFSELLVEESLEQEERLEYISIIQNNNKLLLQLISDILDLSKIEAQMLDFHYEEVDVNALCARIATSSRMRSDVKVPIVFEEPEYRHFVYSDENRIHQVITNLVSNAIKFTHKGSITINVRALNSLELEISVEDTGDGIPEDKVDLVFNRFVKLNPHVQGTGLGLSICKNLVEQFGGQIGVTSTLGKGTRFWFTLPMEGRGM